MALFLASPGRQAEGWGQWMEPSEEIHLLTSLRRWPLATIRTTLTSNGNLAHRKRCPPPAWHRSQQHLSLSHLSLASPYSLPSNIHQTLMGVSDKYCIWQRHLNNRRLRLKTSGRERENYKSSMMLVHLHAPFVVRYGCNQSERHTYASEHKTTSRANLIQCHWWIKRHLLIWAQ